MMHGDQRRLIRRRGEFPFEPGHALRVEVTRILLLGSRPWLDGAWSYFNGHGPEWRPEDDAAGIAYHRNLVEFLNLRDQLLGG